jgi:hypothetical protein
MPPPEIVETCYDPYQGVTAFGVIAGGGSGSFRSM